EGRIAFAGKFEAVQQLLGLGLLTVEPAEDSERFTRRNLVLQGGVLQRRSHLLFHLTGVQPRIDPEDLDVAFIRLTQTDDALNRSRLARPIGTQQAEDLAVTDFEAYA